MKSLAASLIIALGALSTAGAQSSFSYTTDFNGTNYQPNNSLPIINNYATQDNWYNSDASAPLSTVIAQDPGTSSNSLQVGGYYLNATNSTAPSGNPTFAMQGINVQSNSVHFDTIFQLSSGTNPLIHDQFNFTLQNGDGVQLVSVDLTPTASVSTNGNLLYNLGLTSYAGDSSLASISFTNSLGAPVAPLEASISYHLGFNVYNIGQTNGVVDIFSYNAGINFPPTLLGQAAIEGTDWTTFQNNNTTIGIFSATWTLQNTNGTYSDNYMAMNSLAVSSINSVPEPQTWVLFGISGLILVVALRRRARA